jgi:SnoaL-like domain
VVDEPEFAVRDRLAILNTLNSYGYFIDTFQMDRWFALFCEGALFEGWLGDKLLSAGLEINERTLERRERFKREGVQRRHILSSHRFDSQTGATASGQSYFQLYTTRQGETALVNVGVYEWTVESEGGAWKFKTLIARADSGFD